MTADNREQLVARAAELQTLAELVEKYPAEAQLIMAAIEDGIKLGPMQVGEPAGGVTSVDREALDLIEARHAARPR